MRIAAGLLAALACGAILVALLWSAHAGIRSHDAVPERVWRNTAPPRGDEGEFRFAVFGDIQDGPASFIQAYRQAVERGCRFGIVVGDLVGGARDPNYRFLTWLVSEQSPGMPLLAVPGNHDMKDDGFAFRRWIGSTTFLFDHGGCRFIGLDNGKGWPLDASSRAVLSSAAPDADEAPRHTFLFVHIPPDRSRAAEDGSARARENAQEDLALMERIGADRLFTGHRHSYTRRPYGEGRLVLVSNGEGGDMRAGMLYSPKAVSWTLVTVGASAVDDERVSFRPERDLATMARFQAVTAIHPFLVEPPVASSAAALLVLALVIAGVRRARRARRAQGRDVRDRVQYSKANRAFREKDESTLPTARRRGVEPADESSGAV